MVAEIFATTDNGQRLGQNEDNFAVCKDLAVKEWIFKPHERITLSELGAVILVADGMGGANAGEVASDIAQRVVKEQFNSLENFIPNDIDKIFFLKRVIQCANEEIINYQISHPATAGMGTTIVILWATSEKAFVAWCGDSRLYIFNKNRPLKPATDDHSFVWELVKQGKLTPDEARLHKDSNIITQSLGDPSRHPEPEVRTFDYTTGDRFLLCSDGLNSMLSDEHIETILRHQSDTVEACRDLIKAANEAGGKDNITVVLLDVKETTSKQIPVTTEVKKKKETFW